MQDGSKPASPEFVASHMDWRLDAVSCDEPSTPVRELDLIGMAGELRRPSSAHLFVWAQSARLLHLSVWAQSANCLEARPGALCLLRQKGSVWTAVSFMREWLAFVAAMAAMLCPQASSSSPFCRTSRAPTSRRPGRRRQCGAAPAHHAATAKTVPRPRQPARTTGRCTCKATSRRSGTQTATTLPTTGLAKLPG